jgi:molecular chaperone DnaK
VLASENAADIQAKTQALVQASMKIGEAMYGGQAGGGGAGPGDAGPSGGQNEGVVDAEFEEVDGQNKRSA